MNRINPPKQVQLPEKIRKDLELKKAFDDVYWILFQMWRRLGGGTDAIDELKQGFYEFDDLFSIEEAKEQIKSDVITTAADYTTIKDQVIICTEKLTIFLNEEPEDQEVVKVKMMATVVLNAGSRKIDNEDSIIVDFANVQGLPTIDIVYLLELDGWFII